MGPFTTVPESLQYEPDSLDEPSRYTLDGTDITIDYFETGISRMTADGDVLLTYTLYETTWTLSADHVELNVVTENHDTAMPLSAVAEGNIFLTDEKVSFTADGSLKIDFMQHFIKSDSDSVYIDFENGSLVADNIEIWEFTEGDAENRVSRVVVRTFGHTNAWIQLADSGLDNNNVFASTSESMFGALTFNFSEVQIQTVDSTLEILDGDAHSLDFPNSTIVSSNENTLTMPSCGITFNPPTLKSDEGVELVVAENTSVVADFLTIIYPEGGAEYMYVEFTGLCLPPYPEITPIADQRVKITHPDGTFSADLITVTINRDGTRKVFATGCASFEVYLKNIEEIINPPNDEIE